MMFIPDGIKLYEVLPHYFYDANYPKYQDVLWMMFDYRLLITAHRLRKRYGVVYLNNWYWGGDKQYRGWRPLDTGIGAHLSQHKFGRALDMVFKDATADEIRNNILNSPYSDDHKFICGVEMDVGWLHIDSGNRNRHHVEIHGMMPGGVNPIKRIYP